MRCLTLRPSNPFDCKRTIPSDTYMACIAALHADPSSDITLSVEELPRAEGIDRKVGKFRAVEDWLAGGGAGAKPFAYLAPVCLHETPYMRDLRGGLLQAPWFQDIHKTFRTIARLGVQPLAPSGTAARHRTQPQREALVDQLRKQAATLNRATPLDEVRSKAIVAAYGVPLPREKIVADAETSVRAAEAIGYPVVLKAVTPDITHKSDAGLVIAGLAEAQSVRAAAADIVARCKAANARLDGILVAEQVSGGTEMVLGVHRDPEMGPVVMAGMGGVWLELFKDVAFAAPGVGEAGALQAIAETRAFELLRGYRGAQPADIGALARAFAALGEMAVDFGDCLESVDINPVSVRAEGQGVVALDALVVLRPPGD